MKVPKCFREYGGESNDIDWGSVGMAVFTLSMFLFAGGMAVFGLNYFATTTFTGPCAGAGGVGTYAVDYVQCANGKRVLTMYVIRPRPAMAQPAGHRENKPETLPLPLER